jgi:hypothetical protein
LRGAMLGSLERTGFLLLVVARQSLDDLCRPILCPAFAAPPCAPPAGGARRCALGSLGDAVPPRTGRGRWRGSRCQCPRVPPPGRQQLTRPNLNSTGGMLTGAMPWAPAAVSAPDPAFRGFPARSWIKPVGRCLA